MVLMLAEGPVIPAEITNGLLHLHKYKGGLVSFAST